MSQFFSFSKVSSTTELFVSSFHKAARWLDDVPDALTAEAMAAKEGLELAAENGYNKVILEVDCSGLKTLLDGDDGTRSAIRAFVSILQS